MRSRTLKFITIAATLSGCGDKVVFPAVEGGPVDAAAQRSLDGPASYTSADAVPDSSDENESAPAADAATDSSPDAGRD